MQMTCPKCQGEMRQYERSGVTVDQCAECRGIFLDRGELEKIFDAESAWNHRQQQPAVPPAPPAGQYAPPPPQGYPAQAPAPGRGQHYGYHGHYHGHYRNRRRRSFLGELFD
jgi:uncharacterized protein